MTDYLEALAMEQTLLLKEPLLPQAQVLAQLMAAY